MKKFVIIAGLGFLLISDIFISCKKATDNATKIKKDKISGYVQKGPFVNGTSIQMYELNSSLKQTGKIFSTQIIDNKGSFEITDIALSSQYVEFSANGYYFNEFTGDLSPAPLSLYALSDITDVSTVNVNILTHLEKSRVDYLVGKGKVFSEAKDTAQKEVLAIFGYQVQNIDNSEMLDISLNKEENAILLAISIILQGDRTVGDLTELLANITTDIQQDGKINDATIVAKLRTTTLLLDLAKIRSNLEKRYQDLGINTTIPGFEKYINNFLSFTGLKPTATTQAATSVTTTGATLNGTVNANDLSTAVTFEYGTTTAYGSSATASQSPVTGHSNTTVTTAITGLNPGTIYHFRVKSVNSLGTVYGNDLTFTSLGGVPSATTQAATTITTTGATLNGTVNANDLSTAVTFEYGTTDTYGSTATASQSPVTGHSNTTVTAALTGLNPGTLYHFRVKSVNSIGTVNGSDLTFTSLGGVPNATTQAATSITTTSATLTGSVNPNSLSTIVTFEWGKTISYGDTINPTQSPITGSSSVSVSSGITGLSPGTLYHFRIKTKNALGTVYGNDLTFTTLGAVPTATTQAATAITTSGATLNGSVNANDLSTSVTFEYGTTDAYGSTASVTQSPITGHTSSTVSATLTGLNPGILYHFRVKAVNSLGISNGNDLTFTTLGRVPTATTLAATNITTSSATLKGNADGNYLSLTVTFEWGTTTNYGLTIPANSASGYYYADAMVLAAGTTFHYRIKAVNSLGTTYGNDMTFTTFFTGITGTVNDIDGNSYKTIGIGSQMWMAENLKTTKYSNGDLIGTTTPATKDIQSENTPKYQWSYEGIESNVATYGRLYTWYVVTDSRNVCSTGWHIPTDAEWTTLTDYLTNNGYGYGGSGNDIGKSMAATSTWFTNGIAGTVGNDLASNNSSGFTALPSGYRNWDGNFYYIGKFSYMWQAKEWDVPNANVLGISYDFGTAAKTYFYKIDGMSVRCLRDN